MWTSVNINIQNTSSFDLKPSTNNPPVTDGGQLQYTGAISTKLETVPPGQSACVTVLTRASSSEGTPATCFLTYEFAISSSMTGTIGTTVEKLLIWVYADPDRDMADVKIGAYAANKAIDSTLLNGITLTSLANTVPPPLDSFTVVELNVNSDTHEIGVGAELKEDDDLLEDSEDMDQHWKGTNPNVWVFVKDFSNPATASTDGSSTKFEIDGGKLSPTKPVHENLTLAALIQSNAKIVPDTLKSSINYNMIANWHTQTDNSMRTQLADLYEFFRGVVWNDDPACALFFDDKTRNNWYATGVDWLLTFKQADWARIAASAVFGGLSGGSAAAQTAQANKIIIRSHYGDLQFLHAMATQPGDKPAATLQSIMAWLQTMYGLAVGTYNETTLISGTPIASLFKTTDIPKSSDNLRTLLLGKTTSYSRPLIQRRALGSCFHLIQDSFAIGRCQRVLTNKNDLIKTTRKLSIGDAVSMAKKFITSWGSPKALVDTALSVIVYSFPQGKPGRFGKVKNFHSYKGQDDDRHGFYDKIDSSVLAGLKPTDPTSFDRIIGARDAIDACATLALNWNQGKKWDTVGPILAGVFALDASASVSNTTVDNPFG